MTLAWISRTPSNTYSHQTVAYNGTRFIALNNSGSLSDSVMTSTDGINWTDVAILDSFAGKRLLWTGSQFLGLSMQFPPKSLTSSDGLTWVRNDFSGPSFNPFGVAWNGTTFVGIASSSDRVYTSPDGIAWTEQSTTDTPGFGDIVWTGSKFVIAGEIGTVTTRVSTSSDGITWTSVPTASPNDLSCIASNGATVVAMSLAGTNAYVSTDHGATWTSHATGGVSQINSICFGNGKFVAVGQGAALTSSNGTSWTVITAAQASSWVDVVFGNDAFVAVSSNGLVMSAPDAAPQSSAVLFAPSPILTTALSSANVVVPPPLLAATGTMRGFALINPPAGTMKFFSGGLATLRPTPCTLAFFGGSAANLTCPSPSFTATGRDSPQDNSLVAVTPSPNFQAFCGASAALALPAPSLSITGTVSGLGQAAISPASPTLVADGRVSNSVSAVLRAPATTLIGYAGAVCSVTIGRATLQATGTAGSIGGATLTCPLFELTASGTRQNVGRAELLAPAARMGATAQAWLIAPSAQLTAIGTAVVTATYETYSINLTHKPRRQGEAEAIDEVTRYTNFPFTQIVRYQNSYFGVAADGLYLLEGTTDNGTPIAYAVRTAVDDFKISEKKILSSAYLSGRIGPTLTTTVYAGETGQVVYPYSTPRGQGAQNHREKFGKGVKGRYFALGFSGTDAMEIDAVEIDDSKLARRI